MSYEKLNDIWHDVDGIILTSPHALRYFTGFCGGEGIALIAPNLRCLFVDSRYTVEALKEAPAFEVIEFSAGQRDIRLLERMDNMRVIGYEDEFFTVTEFHRLKENCKEIAEWVGMSHKLELLRMIKTDEELSCLKQAEQIAADAFLAVLPQMKVGISEIEIAAELEYQMRKRGSEGTAFETIVVSGAKTSMPHGKPDTKKIAVGDFVTMDFGCVYQGYCSDMTRTVAMGTVTKEQKNIYETVQKAQQQGLDAICQGVCAKDADDAARKVIDEAGYGKYFGHSLGHGVGLLIHELPNLSPKSEIVLQPGMVVTCEPGIYIPDLGGVRIEDMVCVTKNGIENFTPISKDLLIL